MKERERKRERKGLREKEREKEKKKDGRIRERVRKGSGQSILLVFSRAPPRVSFDTKLRELKTPDRSPVPEEIFEGVEE